MSSTAATTDDNKTKKRNLGIAGEWRRGLTRPSRETHKETEILRSRPFLISINFARGAVDLGLLPFGWGGFALLVCVMFFFLLSFSCPSCGVWVQRMVATLFVEPLLYV